MFTFKNWKKDLQFVMGNDCPRFLTLFFMFPPNLFTLGKQSYFEISEMTTHTHMNHALEIFDEL